ncbi:HAD-superfamily subfamily IIA hydrolase, hypothetical 2 [Marinobacterium lacunae]|uniref:Haloacid dehalogenase-like hydrolase domain-containing protein 2 n=1 Tax=Marinobacterium lacunae TaxID=1232683 RepID=A0A081FZB0_9GAMM|nr:TIGR01458 family HAD-type hydrolase [Marinobacterium lacunae]KEA63865.1 HAD-superfamily subfamily IIA hydrolase, hypothetical 2 [Marinobacterium lacunae]
MFKGVLLDLDGVVYVDDYLIEGALSTIQWLNAHHYAVRFITNTSTKTRNQLIESLQRLEIPALEEQVFSAVQAAESWLEAQSITRVAPLVSDSVRLSLSERFEIDEMSPEVVLIGDIGDLWCYDILNRAFHWLMAGAKLVCIHRNRYWLTGGEFALDIGAFVAALEYAAGVKAVVIGKPSTEFFHEACRSMVLPPEDVLVVGDDIEADVGGAQLSGCTGVLVETGKYDAAQVERSSIRPYRQIASIADLPELLDSSSSDDS